MTEPWTPGRLSAARRHFSLSENATHEEVERHIHFEFQRLFRKPPDDWSNVEQQQWEHLGRYVDVERYQRDNPPTDTRIGRLVSADAHSVWITWNSRGERSYDARSVPPEVITATAGWVIHAVFDVRGGDEVWLAAHVGPPFPSDDETIAADIAAEGRAPSTFAPAEWPKNEE